MHNICSLAGRLTNLALPFTYLSRRYVIREGMRNIIPLQMKGDLEFAANRKNLKNKNTCKKLF